MKKLKRLALMTIMLIAVSIIGGCSSKTDDKLETLTILYPGDEGERMSEFMENEFAEKMAEDLNVKVEVIYVPWDQYWEQKDIMLAANEPIDLYWDGLPSLSTMVNKKQARVLNDLIDQYGQDMLKVLPKEQLEGATINGDIYGIPSSYAPSSAMYQLVCVRQDIMDAVGMTKLNTAEDLKEFAKRTSEKFPDLKGPSDIIFKPLTRYFEDEPLTFIAAEDLIVFGEDTNKVYSYYEAEAFKKVAKFNREMYQSGYYSDDLTIKYNERDSRMQTGQYTWVEGSLGKENEIIDTVKANAPDAKLKSYLLAEEKPRYIIATGGEVLCIPQTAPNPEGAMKFINWLYSSEENYLFALYGVEGKDYEIVDGRIKKIADNDFFYEWMFRNQNYQLFSPDIDQSYIDLYKSWDDNAIRSKTLGFNFNNENVKEIETAIKEVGLKDFAAIRSGFVDFDTEYPKAVKKLKEAGIDEYIAEVQRQFDEFLASQEN
ncbi:carbohydrate ABC transporter substrate-binding protein (CUT1 family) [Mobilisporobacter senegalensis]|uniref:Carbohydrate ABC transporter substrate-binding protein (CUT1 family) n=1 Tax=Mobilisporobacter senegalensis TaxID=1329262 RepID=A0A3N1XL07_9FIRM|nr:extracellular solute-binding protein [Mobilisporobacter senegalensis]ROR27395.1 carbohydrate ABC transporter substrate-binding protein (CUT1 family) [Mobilisporobacter senegalensis]